MFEIFISDHAREQLDKLKDGEKVFEAYAEQSTPAAYRIFWHYGSGIKQLTIIAITPHP